MVPYANQLENLDTKDLAMILKRHITEDTRSGPFPKVQVTLEGPEFFELQKKHQHAVESFVTLANDKISIAGKDLASPVGTFASNGVVFGVNRILGQGTQASGAQFASSICLSVWLTWGLLLMTR